MKTKCFFSVLLVCVLTSGFAQQTSNPDSLKNDIGFNTVFILNGVFNSSQTPFSLMYKKYTSENKAIRIGASINIDWNNPDFLSVNSNTTSYFNSYANVSLVLGKEFQSHINKRWIWYYGADLVPSFSITENSTYQNGIKGQESNSKSYGLSARPFLGIRFAINHRLYLSAETNISAGYKRFTTKNKSFDPDNVYSGNKGDNISFTMNPASGLYLYYRFR